MDYNQQNQQNQQSYVQQNYQQPQVVQPKQRSKLVAFLLCWLLGVWGVHRFYTGKIWTGILYLLTGGLCGIGTFIDLLRITFNGFPDKQRYPLKNDIPTWLILLLWFGWIVVVGIVGVLAFSTDLLAGLLAGIF